MSRTIRKYPSWKDNQDTKLGKRRAAKAVRKSKDVSNGSSFKRVFESWNIVDFKNLIFSKKEADNLEKKGYYRAHQMKGSKIHGTTRSKKRIQRPDKSNS